jgi:hypothetical protein
MSKVWFITGSGSGIGAATAKAALEVLTASSVWLRALVAEITPNFVNHISRTPLQDYFEASGVLVFFGEAISCLVQTPASVLVSYGLPLTVEKRVRREIDGVSLAIVLSSTGVYSSIPKSAGQFTSRHCLLRLPSTTGW